MFKLIGWCLKAAFFTILVIVASHLITWNGKTVSDQVRSSISSAERVIPGKNVMKSVKRKSIELIDDTKDVASKIGIAGTKRRIDAEGIDTEDRERLQALIHSSGEN